MIGFEKNKNLKSLNTFGLEVHAQFFTEISDLKDLHDLIKNAVFLNHPKLILGGGSNILFTENFEGLVIRNLIKGIQIVSQKEDTVVVKVGAGENWQEFVEYCIKHGFGGIENLSLIPGCVGAGPMQNIGAYGVEIKDVFYSLTAFDMLKGEFKIFNKQECEFGYRESVFKHQFKNKYIITDVSFILSKKPKLNIQYGAIGDELKKMGVTEPTIADVSKAVIAIRQSKLPDPKEMGNAGSFFKNPEIKVEKYNELKSLFENMVAYPLENGNYKLAAGWLIEQCGLKGFEMKGAAVHNKQALVLVNKNNSTGKNIYDLSTYVFNMVFDKFGVMLEREVNII